AGKTTVTASIIVDNSVGRFTFQDDAELIVKEDVFSWHLTEGTLDQKSFTVDLNNPNIITVKARIKGKFKFNQRYTKSKVEKMEFFGQGAAIGVEEANNRTHKWGKVGQTNEALKGSQMN